MDAGLAALAILSQMFIPGLFAWSLFKSERRCRQYEEMLERQHRRYIEHIAKIHGIPLIESETTDELFERMRRLQEWRSNGLTTRGGP